MRATADLSVFCLIHQNYESSMNILNSFFLKLQCDFKKGVSAQNFLLVMVGKLRKIRDKKEFLLRFSLTCSKLLTVYHTVYL